MFRFFIVLLFFVVSSIYSAFATGNCTKRKLDEIDTYLNTLDKVAIKFIQTATNNDDEMAYTGLFLIQKPSKFRINYDIPHPLLIVGTKNFISIYDYDLEELSRVDAEDNIFKFLLELNINIQKFVVIEQCYYIDNSIELLVRHTKTDQKSMIIFEENPIKLKEMLIPYDGNDINNGAIRISFREYFYYSRALNDDFFSIKDIKIFGALKRYSSDEILKNIKEQ